MSAKVSCTVSRGVSGVVISPSHPTLTQSPELWQSMGCAGRERVRQHFDWERKVDRILEIYQQMIDPCPKP